MILHWLGEAFDPQLRGYWGSTDVDRHDTFLDLVRDHAAKVDGVKVSLLSAEHETGLRAALPAGVRLYTGDDFNYPELIRGDGTHHSDALLGAFAAVAPAASAALPALDDGDLATYDAAMAPTLPLSRHLFAAPTFHYKTGIAFLAWLNGHQPGFTMVGGLQSARSAVHLAGLELAEDAGVLRDPDLAAARMRRLARRGGAVPHDAPVLDVPSGRPARVATPAPATRGWPAVAQPAHHQRVDLREAIDGCRAARASRASASGASRSPRWASRRAATLDRATRGCGSPRCAAAGSSPRGPGERAAPARRQPPGHRRRPRARRAPTLVMVPGGLPAGDRDMVAARERVADADRRAGARTPLEPASGSALEPMHPMYAPTGASCPRWARRSTSPTQFPVEAVGVVVDTFHVWWDPAVAEQIARAGRSVGSRPTRSATGYLPLAGRTRCSPAA